MVTRVMLALALTWPLAAGAEDMFKWRDARGRIHYSNDTEKVPAGAQVVAKQLGAIGGEPIGEIVAAPEEAPAEPAPRGPAARWRAGDTSCVADLGLLALPHRPVDFDRREWFDVDYLCGPQSDIEGWLRRASTALELRKVGL